MARIEIDCGWSPGIEHVLIVPFPWLEVVAAACLGFVIGWLV